MKLAIIVKDSLIVETCRIVEVDSESFKRLDASSIIRVVAEIMQVGINSLNMIKFSPFGSYIYLDYEDTDIVQRIEVYWESY